MEAREGYQVYLNTLESYLGDIEARRTVSISVIDSATWELLAVEALIARSLEDLPESQPLWVRGLEGQLQARPWAIKVLKVLSEEEVDERIKGKQVG